jgi:hypothetical protein
MKDLMDRTLAIQRIEVALLAAMASLALLRHAVGILALVANIVAQRTREIAIRIALGATIQKTMMHIGRSGVAIAGRRQSFSHLSEFPILHNLKKPEPACYSRRREREFTGARHDF